MEPWLDSLSEDWNSEPHLSSPSVSLSHDGKHASVRSQSRIPHLSQSLRKDSTGSYLKPRSTRGIAKASGRVLTERSASSLNLPNSPGDNLRKIQASNLPRRVSSNFSGSQSSVQHHSVNKNLDTQETPEWKRRLANGEDIASDGFDLFSPSKLEGMFADPAPAEEVNQQPALEGNSKPWGTLKLGHFSSTVEQYQSLRASRNKLPLMEALQEMNEDENEAAGEMTNLPSSANPDQDLSAISSDLAREGSLRGLVRRRVSHLEQPPKAASHVSQDPRWRTVSGQQEIKNEVISPITVSATNTIRESAVRISAYLAPEQLRKHLENVIENRPSSSASDYDVSYVDQSRKDGGTLPNEMTSHSLPDDLSMGTQDLLSNTRNQKRRAAAVSTGTRIQSTERTELDHSSQVLRSSPPFPAKSIHHQNESNDLSDLLPELLSDTSIVHHTPSPIRPSSGPSPLKLFGNRDTYTSNKLMRVLNQFGQDTSTRDNSLVEEGGSLPESNMGNGLRMSQFGAGELDSFHFEKEVQQPKTHNVPLSDDSERIFRNIGRSNAVERNRLRHSSSNKPDQNEADEKQKRLPSSPAKDRTPKRRRTLLKDEIFVEGVGIEVKLDQVPDMNSAMAGKKRKDARPGESGEQADANVLAKRTILRPKAGSRKSSASSQGALVIQDTQPEPQTNLTQALAAELESFTKGAAEAHQDSRKASLATKDYMEEANKVMEFIRARGKPMAKLSDIHEPIDMIDDILDLELEDESTKESFSRPPSRERPSKPREDRRIAKHDAQTADQLRKYQETEDLELLASTSVIGTLNMVDNEAATEAARVPIPTPSFQESSPQNIRLTGPIDDAERGMRKLAIAEQQSSVGSSNHTIATGSSGSSGRKGIISHGTVSIPEKVGTMTFDREKQVWVKRRPSNSSREVAAEQTPKSTKETTFDDDPFMNIPDLSIDEQHELGRIMAYQLPLADQPGGAMSPSQDEESDGPESESLEATSISNEDNQPPEDNRLPPGPLKSEASKHEARLHEGLSSVEPFALQDSRKQARAVTISLSSTGTSQIQYDRLQDNFDDDDASFLPPDDSDYEDYIPTPGAIKTKQVQISKNPPQTISQPRIRPTSVRNSILLRKPMPVIAEHDHSNIENADLSLVHVNGSLQMTPRGNDAHALVQQGSAYKGSSILCLTPLSEFTMHQADAANTSDESFVAARPHPKALLQAHGALALSKDEMIKAITDATADEPFWEKKRDLDLREKKLTSLNALLEYCPVLEDLCVAQNSITQVSGLPNTIRRLDISINYLNDFTSWGHLHNLQYINVSGNKLESLEGFSSLYHLRELNASNNRIREIEGIFDLDGLITLCLSGNEIAEVDFGTADLKHLRKLDVGNNRLTSVKNAHALPRLEQLTLDWNSLRDFTVSADMPKLKTLSLAHNELEELDLSRFIAIQNLDLDDNSVRQIPSLSSSKLRKLSARGQRHSFDFVNTILAIPNECNELYLSSNAIAEGLICLPQQPHYNLQHLELAGCGLRALPRGFGDFFPNCRELNMNFNAVSDLSPLLGSVKLHGLMLASNRIQRLRRCCLVLSRLPALGRLDVRDNPLTIGFYAPPNTSERKQQPFTLVDRDRKLDEKWLHVLDETTALRRRIFELMLADGCKSLTDLDGMVFTGSDVLKTDLLWSSLSSKGVIMKPAELESVEAQASTDMSQRCPKDESQAGAADREMEPAETFERSLLLE